MAQNNISRNQSARNKSRLVYINQQLHNNFHPVSQNFGNYFVQYSATGDRSVFLNCGWVLHLKHQCYISTIDGFIHFSSFKDANYGISDLTPMLSGLFENVDGCVLNSSKVAHFWRIRHRFGNIFGESEQHSSTLAQIDYTCIYFQKNHISRTESKLQDWCEFIISFTGTKT